MDIVLHHRFNADVHGIEREGNRITLDIPAWKPLAFSVPTSGLADAIVALGGDGASVETLVRIAAVGLDAGEATKRVEYYLERFRRARLLEWLARRDGEVIAILHSLTGGFGLAEGAPPDEPMTLSRFAYARRDASDLLLESPETPCRAILKGSGTDLLRWVADRREGLPAADPLLALLWRAGFLEPAARPEADDRATWEFHDRLFHVASRSGRDAIPVGGTYRFKDRFPAPPAIKPPMSADRILLPPPDMAAVAERSDRLATIMDRRRSTRDYAATPITIGQISEFLFRVARIIRTFSGGGQELMSRPFPSGGSIYEIEFYLAVGACEGLSPALYYYRGVEHALERLPDTADGAKRLLADAGMAMAQPDRPPHVLVVLAARLPRFAWKYQSMAYRLTLMNAGVIIQTMYLVATDMGIAGCANGSGNMRTFADATGLDPLVETSVGEFAIGSLGSA